MEKMTSKTIMPNLSHYFMVWNEGLENLWLKLIINGEIVPLKILESVPEFQYGLKELTHYIIMQAKLFKNDLTFDSIL